MTRAAAVLLLVVGAVAHYLPEVLAALFGGLVGAWWLVCIGAAMASVMLAIAVRAPAFAGSLDRRALIAIRGVALWQCLEWLMVGGCRLLHPMDLRMALGTGQTSCTAALGESVAWMSRVAAFGAAWAVAFSIEGMRRGR